MCSQFRTIAVTDRGGGGRISRGPPFLACFFVVVVVAAFHYRGRSYRRTVYPYPNMKVSPICFV